MRSPAVRARYWQTCGVGRIADVSTAGRESATDRSVVTNRTFRGLAIGWLVLLSAMSAMGAVDPVMAEGRDDSVILPVLFVVAPLILAARAGRIGVQVSPDTVVVRNWFRTRRLPRRSVALVEVDRYCGYLSAFVCSPFLRQLVIVAAEGEVEVPSVVGLPGKIARLRDNLDRLLAASADPRA